MRLVVPGCVNDLRSMPWVRVFVIGTMMALYLASGASLFQAIEQPLEIELERKLMLLKDDFLKDHPCVKDENNDDEEARLTTLNPSPTLSMPLLDDDVDVDPSTFPVAGPSGLQRICVEDDTTSGEAV